MATHHEPRSGSDNLAVNDRDILFECPSCNKSLVVDDSAEGMIIGCPQCHINVIVPPRPARPPPPSVSTAPRESRVFPAPEPLPPAPVAAPAPAMAREEPAAVAEIHQQLTAVAARLKEVQTQWADATNRIATRINDINRDLVGLTRLEASHKELLKDWNQVISRLAEVNEQVMRPTPSLPKK